MLAVRGDILWRGGLLAVLAVCSGCTWLAWWDGELPDGAAAGKTVAGKVVADERVVLETFFVHLPLAERELADKIWNEVDEQQVPGEMRQRLAQHGFRLGVVGGQLPAAIEEIRANQGSTATAAQTPTESGEVRPLVSRQELRLRPGSRGEIVPSVTHDKVTVMSLEHGELTGRTYYAAQGRLRLVCQPLADGRVRAELLPELHHGQSRRRGVGDDGILRLELGQEKLVLEDLRMAVTLSPGQMLLVGCREQPLRSLGRDFFCDTSSGKALQKLVVLNLVQAGGDDGLPVLDLDDK